MTIRVLSSGALSFIGGKLKKLSRETSCPSRTFRQSLSARPVKELTSLTIWSGVPSKTTSQSTSAGGTEFNDPVGRIEDVKVVFDHQHRMSEVDQFVKYANERHRRVAKVQSCRRFVEDEELPCAVAAATSEQKAEAAAMLPVLEALTGDELYY